MTQNDESPVERKKSRWWPTRGGAVRILAALLAVGVLLFVVRSYYVGFLLGRPLTVLGAAAVVAAVVVLIRVGQHYEWTGFGKLVQPQPDNEDVQPRKTLWDWLQLLIVPVALAGIGFWFTVQQDARQQEIENQRAQAEQELAVQRAQDEALQAYLDQMSTLLLEKDLRSSEEDSEVRTLARARTLTVLERLDPSRKDVVMQFLMEADLVRGIKEKEPVIRLSSADLSGVKLIDADLRGADLYLVTLKDADLRGANLFGADLSSTGLFGANLTGTDLRYANLRYANMSDADLSHVDNLSDPDLFRALEFTSEQLDQQAASLEGAIMPDGQEYEEWLKSRGEENSGPS